VVVQTVLRTRTCVLNNLNWRDMTSAGSDAAGDAARMLEASSLAATASHEAGPVHQQLAAASIATVPLDYGTALPAHVMALVYSHLALKDTLNASSTCSYWRR
jgi:hypothetical protein